MSRAEENAWTEQDPPAGAVVVGVEGGEHDAVVLTAGVAEAVRRGAPLHVRHCREALDPGLTFAAGVVLDTDDASERVIEVSLATVAALDDSVSVTADRPAGRPDNLLVAAGEDAAAVVIGSGSRSRLEELMLGSVALNVAAHADCPVLLVPPSSDPDGAGHVVVGVDGSDHSRAALAAAVDAARGRGARLEVITTWQVEVVGGYVVTEPDSDEWRRVEERILQMQEGLLEGLDTGGVEVELRSVKGGIRTTLAEESTDAALVVVGNRGRGGFRGKLLGSVTMDLMRRASCPVLVVH